MTGARGRTRRCFTRDYLDGGASGGAWIDGIKSVAGRQCAKKRRKRERCEGRGDFSIKGRQWETLGEPLSTESTGNVYENMEKGATDLGLSNSDLPFVGHLP